MGRTIFDVIGGAESQAYYLIVPSQLNWYFKECLSGLGSNTAAEVLSALYQRRSYLEGKLGMDLTNSSFTATNADIESYTHFSRHSQVNAMNFLVTHGLIELSYQQIPNSKRVYRQVKLNDKAVKDLSDIAVAEYILDDNSTIIIDGKTVLLKPKTNTPNIETNENKYEIDTTTSVTDIITNTFSSTNKNESKQESSTPSTSSGSKNYTSGLKRTINKTGYPGDITEMFCDWVDVVNDKHGYINKYTLGQAQKIIDPIVFGKKDLDKARAILELTVANGWKDLSYAVEKVNANPNKKHKLTGEDNVHTTICENPHPKLADDIYF